MYKKKILHDVNYYSIEGPLGVFHYFFEKFLQK